MRVGEGRRAGKDPGCCAGSSYLANASQIHRAQPATPLGHKSYSLCDCNATYAACTPLCYPRLEDCKGGELESTAPKRSVPQNSALDRLAAPTSDAALKNRYLREFLRRSALEQQPLLVLPINRLLGENRSPVSERSD
ncbi:hypothetical protein EVAR_41100_1 [Eumeta japonica]|uniref:Uncharacterized protein n=1 Tax=Eumeta variegata TaxID=151549 RepID=A0A4C1XAB2_EUMVA|nr:hypothetical protein EVAR_41100_1 [Eumeta japonica]